jgi:transcriptional regulator with XRE-family HTH domain
MGRKVKVRKTIELSTFDIEWLKATRVLLKLSMEDVAEIMHVTKGTISRIEAGASNTKKHTILLYELVLKELVRTSYKNK